MFWFANTQVLISFDVEITTCSLLVTPRWGVHVSLGQLCLRLQDQRSYLHPAACSGNAEGYRKYHWIVIELLLTFKCFQCTWSFSLTVYIFLCIYFDESYFLCIYFNEYDINVVLFNDWVEVVFPWLVPRYHQSCKYKSCDKFHLSSTERFTRMINNSMESPCGRACHRLWLCQPPRAVSRSRNPQKKEGFGPMHGLDTRIRSCNIIATVLLGFLVFGQRFSLETRTAPVYPSILHCLCCAN